MKKSIVLLLMAVLLIAVAALAGCGAVTEKYVNGSYAECNPEFGKPDLGGIVTEGDFVKCNDKNLLKFRGYYKGSHFITLVFDSSSPVDGKMLERYVDKENERYLQGVIYKKDLTSKYVTFQFEPLTNEKTGLEFDRADTRFFEFPENKSEPESYYFLSLRSYGSYQGISGIRKDNFIISHRTQKEVVEQSYWTDYKFDETVQYYDDDTGKWTTEKLVDQMTNNMPLE